MPTPDDDEPKQATYLYVLPSPNEFLTNKERILAAAKKETANLPQPPTLFLHLITRLSLLRRNPVRVPLVVCKVDSSHLFRLVMLMPSLKAFPQKILKTYLHHRNLIQVKKMNLGMQKK